MSAVSIGNLVVCFLDPIESTMLHLLPDFSQNLILIRCSKNRSPIPATRRINTSYQRHIFHTTGVKALKQ
jgi:hypothetical protein